jgi:hypothetical protein
MESLRYTDIKSKKDRVLRLTGLTAEEFEQLCAKFSEEWSKFIKTTTLECKPRQQKVKK